MSRPHRQNYDDPRPDLTGRRRRSYLQQAALSAMRDGLIKWDAPCLVCGARPENYRGPNGKILRTVEWHHPNPANQPRWVLPLCGQHHRMVHAGKIAEPITGRVYPPRSPRPSRPAA